MGENDRAGLLDLDEYIYHVPSGDWVGGEKLDTLDGKPIQERDARAIRSILQYENRKRAWRNEHGIDAETAADEYPAIYAEMVGLNGYTHGPNPEEHNFES